MDHMQCPRVIFFLVIIGVRQMKWKVNITQSKCLVSCEVVFVQIGSSFCEMTISLYVGLTLVTSFNPKRIIFLINHTEISQVQIN